MFGTMATACVNFSCRTAERCGTARRASHRLPDRADSHRWPTACPERAPALRGGEPPLSEYTFKVDAADAARHRRLRAPAIRPSGSRRPGGASHRRCPSIAARDARVPRLVGRRPTQGTSPRRLAIHAPEPRSLIHTPVAGRSNPVIDRPAQRVPRPPGAGAVHGRKAAWSVPRCPRRRNVRYTQRSLNDELSHRARNSPDALNSDP